MSKTRELVLHALSGALVGLGFSIIEIAWKARQAKREAWKLAIDAEKAANPGTKD